MEAPLQVPLSRPVIAPELESSISITDFNNRGIGTPDMDVGGGKKNATPK